MPMSYILQRLDALKKEINRLERFFFDLKSENRSEIKELKKGWNCLNNLSLKGKI